MVSIQLLILPILAAVVCAAPQGRPGVAISAPSMAGKYGAALFGQRYNENTDADRVTLNLGFKKESGQSAGSNMGSSGAYGGGGMGGAPGPYGPGPGHNPFGPQGPNPGGNPYGGNPYGGNPYGPGAGAGGGGYGGMNSGGHASQYDKLGLDLGITREKGQKNASGQQQGVMVGLGRR